jgi:enoyl-CoA hydratase/carnithine racemase
MIQMTRAAVVTGTGGNAFRSGADLGRLIALMSPACSRQSGCGRRKGGDQEIRERGHFRASDTVKPGVAAFDGYAIARRVGLARRANLRIGSQTTELGVRELKAHGSTISDRIPIQQNVTRLQGKGVTHA